MSEDALEERRVELGLSQTAVADQLGLTFQQVQKYERGYNRVSASRLYDLGKYSRRHCVFLRRIPRRRYPRDARGMGARMFGN